jgi:hypothetical protein
MIKPLIVLSLTLACLPLWAAPCEVYGISDSPQKLSCEISKEKWSLTCEKGTYYLNEQKVLTAFHFEIEEGPVPLVFKTKNSQLTVIINSKNDISAELQKDKLIRNGNCF